MSTDLASDLREIVLSNSSFGPAEIVQLAHAISDDYANFTALRDAIGELESRVDHTPATAVRLGVCYYLLCRFETARQTLSNADGGAVAQFYLGKTQFELGNYDGAIAGYEAAKVSGYNSDDCDLAIAEALRNGGEKKQAMTVLDQLFGPIEQTSEYLYQRAATVNSLGGNPSEVVALYERAVESSESHAGAMFGLAVENDRRGNDDEAMALYSRASNCFPSHVGALLNLGIMYEDMQRYDLAQSCYQRILDVYPDHEQARLFYKDSLGSRDQLYDEEAQKRTDRLSQVLSIPVTDFELSVRSRNCLQKMGVRSLGDLTRTSEQELLTSKNFGETSLIEIRDMLHSKGLDLGQFAHERSEPEPSFDTSNMSPDEQALLDRPIADLNLSVRARKCMVRLGISTIGELARRSQDDLLECKNFGVTSLNEVREKLGQLNLKLRGD
ncbi:MAG TPA: DNA-directed RNA polymerase subunit alpha C-terminal domain-containing protein [Pirellulaceae bacterium]|jgi:DNA-directed RNA polymerase subunit alpha|nr:DNA-directed RNA polymerase subunit alpha C-terminal domain-containing protein [Pirellulaceae bacterium]